MDKVLQVRFPIKCYIPNKETLEAIEDVRLQRNLHGPYKTAKEAIAAMLEERYDEQSTETA